MKRAEILVLIVALTFAFASATATAQELPAALTPTPSVAVPTPPPAPSEPTTATGAPVEVPEDYLIQAEDILRMSVLGEPELAVEQQVDPKGYINVPLAGAIRAQGLTKRGLTDKIVLGLSKYLVEPKVELTLSQFRKPKVYVLGFVNRPGMIDFRPGDRVMEAIAQAGSFTTNAYLEGATLTPGNGEDQKNLNLHKLFFDKDMSQNLMLQDGDTIYVPENTINQYFVLGEVNRPGKYTLKDKMTVIDAVTEAAGINQQANAKTLYVIRGDPKKPQRIKVDLTKFLKSADMSQNIALQAGDVVYVPQSNKPDWNKISGIVSVIVNTSYLSRLFNF